MPEVNDHVATERPEGLSLLCLLHLISLPFIALWLVSLTFNRFRSQGFAIPFSGPLDMAILRVALQGSLVAAAAVGMWRGRRWGWTCGLFLYSLLIFTHVGWTAMEIAGFAPFGTPHGRTLAVSLALHFGRILFAGTAMLYLRMRTAVARFVGFGDSDGESKRNQEVTSAFIAFCLGAVLLAGQILTQPRG